ncbi:MAG TPA: hypothetical protein PK103_06935 [Elusimicrobiales bacterium]|nr:hypothetical protein [Elusimicrobiales bacterium]HOL63085.1 hypothetical protein [Elusimicrobiales bacterium]HPO95902.1 hypothetical protein [Elusimicrobiales bacterium]
MINIISLLILSLNLNSKDFSYTYPGIRATSMGSAFSSIADDVFSMFYNPAGLTQVKDWEVGSSINAKLSEKNLFDFTLGYKRPLPDTKNTVLGFGYDRVRQSSYGSMDTLIFSYSDQTTLKYFQLPILYGANFRIGGMKYEGNSHIGLGFDAGVILSSVENYKTSLVLSKITTGMGKSMATITVGNSYRYLDTTFALDFRVTGGYSEFFPGIERKFYDDLLRIRVGKGINLNGRDYLAMGAGLNFDPVIIDIGISYPWKGFHYNAGSYGFSLTYKFTGPGYKERMFDDATNKVKELNAKSQALTEQIKNLETEMSRYSTQKGILESEVTILNTRMLELREKVKQAEMELIDIEFAKKKLQKPIEEKTQVKKEEKWPKLHKVENGETLRSISSKYYGTPDMWKIIYDENQSKIFKGLPKEGEILTIPPPKK